MADADTRLNIKLYKNVATDLYAETGIAVGTKISVMSNVTKEGSSTIRLSSKETSPGPEDGWRPLFPGKELVNDSGDLGAWALSTAEDDFVNVRVV